MPEDIKIKVKRLKKEIEDFDVYDEDSRDELDELQLDLCRAEDVLLGRR